VGLEPAANPRLGVMDGPAALWRLRLYGHDEGGARWTPLAALAARVARPGFVFGDVHAALAYAASGDAQAMTALLESLRALAAKGHPVAQVGYPLAEGIAAFAAGGQARPLRHRRPPAGRDHPTGRHPAPGGA